MTAFEGYSDRAYGAICDIVDKSRRYDSAKIGENLQYIKRRLYQIALEYKEGRSEAFRMAIIPYRKDIITAEQLLGQELEH